MKIVLTNKGLALIDPKLLENLLSIATDVTATAVVRDKDGNIKYDDASKRGEFGEQFLEQ